MGQKLKLDLDETIDSIVEPVKIEVPEPVKAVEYAPVPQTITPETNYINPLTNEKVTVRFRARDTGFIDNPRNPLFGGMAETGFRRVSVLKENGNIKSPLTPSEQEYLEMALGKPKGSLSVHLPKDTSFWTNYGIRLSKQDMILDLSNPYDYIKYKVLLANSGLVAPSLSALQSNPKMTQEFVLIKQNEETEYTNNNMGTDLESATLLGTILQDRDKLRLVVETIEGKPVAKDIKLDMLTGLAYKARENNRKLFISVLKDPYLDSKILIRRAVENRIIRNNGGFYYLAEGNTPLCNGNVDPDLENAAKFINNPANQTLKLSIEAKLNALSKE